MRAVLFSWNFDGAELFEVFSDELRIQQQKTAIFKTRDQVDKRNFACISLGTEHAFPEESSTEGHAIKSTDKLRPLPCFHAVHKAGAM